MIKEGSMGRDEEDITNLKLEEIISSEPALELDDWTRLVSRVEKSFPENVEKISLVYEGLLGAYPLCHVYWSKYAAHMARLRGVDNALHLFQRAVLSATYSLPLWLDYCSFASLVFHHDPSLIRRLFDQALSFVGKDYSCHALWDKYIEFEFSQQNWSSLAHIYIQALRFPTKKLKRYYDSFRKLVDLWNEEMNTHCNSSNEVAMEPLDVVNASYKQNDIDRIIEDLVDPSLGLARTNALYKYKSIGEQFYQKSSQLDEKIYPYEARIKRAYFHVKPLDLDQLENWHQYLDFVELDADFDWAVKLYERCLIPCANYPEFWMRYVEFMESKGGREIANLALDRATCTFLQRESAIHLFNARFKEHVGNVLNARAAFLLCAEESETDFVERVVMKANMERRLGNFDEASNTFKEALSVAAADEKWDTVSLLYIHYSKLTLVLTNSEAAARDILIDGIKHVPDNKLLIEELIKFVMAHGGTRHLNTVDSVIASVIAPGQDVSQCLSMKDREGVSTLYLQLADLCGTIIDVRKAWYRHIQIFPHSVRPSFCASPGSKPLQLTKEAPLQIELSLSEQKDQAAHSVMKQAADVKPLTPEFLDNRVLNKELPTLENGNTSSDRATVDLVQSGESNNGVEDGENVISVNLLVPPKQHSEQQHSPNLLEPDTDENDKAQASGMKSEGKVQQDCDLKHDPVLNPLSLEGLSLESQENRPPDLLTNMKCDSEADQESSLLHLASHENEASSDTFVLDVRTLSGDETFQRNATSNRSLSLSGENANADQFCLKVSENQSPSSVSKEKTVPESYVQPHFSKDDRRKWHQRSNPDFHRDSRFRSRRDFRKRQHRRQHGSPQSSALTERGSQMPSILGQPPQPVSSENLQVQQNVPDQHHASASTNLLGPPISAMQSMQQQNIISASQVQHSLQSPSYPEALMSQYSMQSNGQYGMQNNQAYNNYMWQYYCYQQQQILWHQQVPQQHQLLQQQYQQQVLQMQLLGQQQLQQLPSQHQQLQELQQREQAWLQQSLLQQSPQQQQQHLQQQRQLLQQPHQLLPQQFQQQHSLYLQQQQQLQLQEPQQFQQHQHHQQLALAEQQQLLKKELGQTGRQIKTSQEALEGSGEKGAVSQGHMAASGTPDAPTSSHPEQHSS